jgi:hypothetical protein
MHDGPVAFRLAGNASAHAGQCSAALDRDWLTAVVAVIRALSSRHAKASRLDRVLHRVINLVLHCAIARPSAGQLRFLPTRKW